MSHPPLGVTARAKVDRVIDGDTLVVHVEWPLTIRLADCWAPETHGETAKRGEKAKAYLEKIAPPGTPIVVSVGSENATNLGHLLTFGRVVANVWVDGESKSLSQIMVGAGLAGIEKGGKNA